MSIIELKQFLASLGITTVMYPLAFPADSPNVPAEAILIETGNSTPTAGDLEEFILSLTVRAEHPVRAEALSLDIISRLNRLTNQTVGDSQIVLIRSQQKIPQYAGKDENGRHYYTNNFRVLTD